jgi:sulfur-oxidizing protein SoxX
VTFCLGDFAKVAFVPLLSVVAVVTHAQPVQSSAIEGREIFVNPRKGNCVACHPVPGMPSRIDTSRVGPDLTAFASRNQDRKILRAIIWDMSERNANTVMPPYGKHRILTEAEIDAVVEYLEKI